MLTIEKVLILSRADIFAGLQGDSLAEIALLAEEIEVTKDHEISTDGEYSSAMYVVAAGKVLVVQEDSSPFECGPGEVAGELNALDPIGKGGSVKALEDSLLLKIEHENFFDLLSEDVEIAKTVIRSLCRRLRSAGNTGPHNAARK